MNKDLNWFKDKINLAIKDANSNSVNDLYIDALLSIWDENDLKSFKKWFHSLNRK